MPLFENLSTNPRFAKFGKQNMKNNNSFEEDLRNSFNADFE